MAIVDEQSEDLRSVLAEFQSMRTQGFQHVSKLSSSVDRTNLFGLMMFQMFLDPNSPIDVGDLTRMAADFNEQAAAIAAMNTKVIALSAIKDADPAVFAQNITEYIAANNLESSLAEYKKTVGV